MRYFSAKLFQIKESFPYEKFPKIAFRRLFERSFKEIEMLLKNENVEKHS